MESKKLLSYGRSVTDDLEPRYEILTNELGNLMLDSVSTIYNNSKFTLYVFNALGVVLSKETEFISGDFINQIFPQTATWGLDMWEYEYGIPTDRTKPIEERRAYLQSVMFKNNAMTPYRIKQFIKGITGFDIDIEENYAPNTIKIYIRGYAESSINQIKNELNKKLPAHINYVIDMAEKYDIETSIYSACGMHMLENYTIQEG